MKKLSSTCAKEHNSPRRKNGNCIQCEKNRYRSDPRRKEQVKAQQAARRAAIKADSEKLAQQKEYMRDYSARNRAKLSQQSKDLYHRNNAKLRLQRKGIEPTQELISLVENHCGRCDICNGPPTDRWKELAIDHCHSTNGYRGMLCDNCNHGLGKFKDDIDLLQKAMDYLIQFRKTLPGEFIEG